MDIPVNMIKLHQLSILYLDNYYIIISTMWGPQDS